MVRGKDHFPHAERWHSTRSDAFTAGIRKCGEFDVILVHKFDRFARNDYDFIIYEKELEDLGIIVESLSEPGDASTPAGYISRRMMQVISSWYSKNLAVEVKKGLLRKVETGGWPK